MGYSDPKVEEWLCDLPVTTAQKPCCSQPAAKSGWQCCGLTLILRVSTLPACGGCSVRSRSSGRDLSLHCSDGVYAVCGRLLGASAVHVLPDPSERAHLPAEEQAPHGSLWVQWLLHQLRPLSRSGTSSRSPTKAAAAGKWHLWCPPWQGTPVSQEQLTSCDSCFWQAVVVGGCLRGVTASCSLSSC